LLIHHLVLLELLFLNILLLRRFLELNFVRHWSKLLQRCHGHKLLLRQAILHLEIILR
jgi:hypothetical protein